MGYSNLLQLCCWPPTDFASINSAALLGQDCSVNTEIVSCPLGISRESLLGIILDYPQHLNFRSVLFVLRMFALSLVSLLVSLTILLQNVL